MRHEQATTVDKKKGNAASAQQTKKVRDFIR